MPCEVVEQSGTNRYYWFCCNCTNGPMSVKLQPRCTECIDEHSLCVPASSQERNFENKIDDDVSENHVLVEHAIPNSTPYKSGGPSSICSEPLVESDEALSSTDASSSENESEPDTVAHDEDFSTALDEGVKVILNRVFYRDAFVHVHGGIAQPSSSKKQVTEHKRSSKARTRKTKANSGSYGQTPEEDTPYGQWTTVKSGGKPKQDAPTYACPFVKYNAHRHRHSWACARLYHSISELKMHLTRKDGGHILSLDDSHPALQHPVEGIGEELRRKIRDLRCTSVDEKSGAGKTVWYDLYRLLFGDDAELPADCSSNAEDISRSKDISKQGHFRDLCIRTLRLGLPEKFVKKVVQSHLRSILDSEVQHCARLIGTQEEHRCSYNAMTERMDVGPSRCKSRDTEPHTETGTQPCSSDAMDLDYASEEHQNNGHIADNTPTTMDPNETIEDYAVHHPAHIPMSESEPLITTPSYTTGTSYFPLDTQLLSTNTDNTGMMSMLNMSTDVQSNIHDNTAGFSMNWSSVMPSDTYGHLPQLAEAEFLGITTSEETKEEDRRRVLSAEKDQDIPENIGDINHSFAIYTQHMMSREPESMPGYDNSSTSQVEIDPHQPEEVDFDSFLCYMSDANLEQEDAMR